jgi:hypothetical protein
LPEIEHVNYSFAGKVIYAIQNISLNLLIDHLNATFGVFAGFSQRGTQRNFV